MTSDTTSPTVARRVARLATEVLAPWVWVLGLPPVIAWHADGTVGGALLWGLIVGITGSVIPMIVIIRGARRGRWDSHHVTNREGRLIPFIACVGSLGCGIAILVLGGAPRQMIALALAMFASLVVSIAITFALPVGGVRGWKISMHAGVAAGSAVILTITYGPWLALVAGAVVLVAWSRVELGDHTTAQVVAGSALGLVVGGLPYWWLVANLT
ncbi:phosphatase PAP2 family protein [Saccharothrix sp. S26]|uniref:phosphatase PAP2 family protein n=1 Tax=Saccharothrix sp. S26 TaxID=2907215 RepID=UPI001F409E2F|nr:phosphatase PAP2 family protein [Saccharothrix sp. S26]MCE7001135.1 phosphatase PAP2 family protein [Saccharothrix sp. S26]